MAQLLPRLALNPAQRTHELLHAASASPLPAVRARARRLQAGLSRPDRAIRPNHHEADRPRPEHD
jgi:hypothetical protein